MEWLSLVLGAGGVAFVGALFQGIKMYRDSTSARMSKAIADLERWREDADRRTREALAAADSLREEVSYWQTRAGRMEYVIIKNGLQDQVPPPPSLPERPVTPEGRAGE